MRAKCERCCVRQTLGPKLVRKGFYFRKSDGQLIQRYRCPTCKKSCSGASDNACFGQNKRNVNEILRRLLCSGISLRRAAIVLRLNRITVVRKLEFLSRQAATRNQNLNKSKKPCTVVEFDDMETIEHTKLKPLSITLAVEHGSRRILGFAVSQMPAKGMLSRIAVKKYGRRKDKRPKGRAQLFAAIAPFVARDALIKSDQNPHYPADVKKYFPHAYHESHKGRRGSVTGQGELKKVRFDPLFSLNHTCAMFRANVNRLFRKTWCTTKRPDRLTAHLNLYVEFHNRDLGCGNN